MGRAVKPHDLLRIAFDPHAFPDAPEWVGRSLFRAPYGVVRRTLSSNGAIAVGIRGTGRHERFGTWLDSSHVMAVVTPEALRGVAPEAGRIGLPAFALLRAIAPLCDDTGCAWGPTGSAGFELASGAATVTPTSDLDLLLRAPTPLTRKQASDFHTALSNAASATGTRIDIQVETFDSVFSLAEFARPGVRVMLRSPAGPMLVTDPWQRENVA
jgi:phosphoribosyl-dephospho-CoA transferase